MSRYFAELNAKGLVVRVVVCDDPQWLTERLGGTWVETRLDDATEKYAGIGEKYDPNSPTKFVPDPEKPAPEPEPKMTTPGVK